MRRIWIYLGALFVGLAGADLHPLAVRRLSLSQAKTGLRSGSKAPLRERSVLGGGFNWSAQSGHPDRSSKALKGFARGVRPARAVVTRAVGITQPGRPIRGPQQQQEECPVSLVFGSGSAAVRTLHDNLPFGRAHAPPPSPASLLQDHFKNRKLIGHCNRSIDQVEFHTCVVPSRRRVQNLPRGRQNSTTMPE